MAGDLAKAGGVGLGLRDIFVARRALAGRVTRTPLVPARALSAAIGREVLLKLETTQPTGAFKLRGATNRLLAMSEDERARGVVTVSTGNHGRAVAHAARALRMRAVVCMSRLVPDNKRQAVAREGAEIHIHGAGQDEAQTLADRMAREEGLIPVPPFDDAHVVAGQGTIGLELLEDRPDLDSVLVPLSGGGLIGGIALAIKSAAPAIRIVGISMAKGAAMHASLEAGRPIEVVEEHSLADSLGGGIGLDNRLTFALVRDLVDDVQLVDEDAIARAMAHVFWQERLVVEGAAAVGIALLLEGRLDGLGQRICCILSGNNVDMDAFARIVGPSSP